MTVLITGINGFTGSNMADYALAMGAEVYGTIRWRSSRENIAHLEEQIKLVECNLCDAAPVHVMIKAVKPDRIAHLAAQTYVPTSWHAPTETLDTNIRSTVNIGVEAGDTH